MSVAAFQHMLPWTEEEYLQLGETPDRVELFDWSLFVSPSATPEHQDVSACLSAVLRPAAKAAGLAAYQAINIRLRPGRIPIPDLVIVDKVDPRAAFIDGAKVRLVCEIVSPNNGAVDRVLKMHYYAEAGIEWYLLVEPRPELVLQLFRLHDGGYSQHAHGQLGQPLVLTEPVEAVLDPAAFLD
jgi:Uma2 family endonuclease